MKLAPRLQWVGWGSNLGTNNYIISGYLYSNTFCITKLYKPGYKELLSNCYNRLYTLCPFYPIQPGY